MISEIYNRRSIRKFIDNPISQKDITDIIHSGIKAPSSKNRQPWKYIVIQGNSKEEMLKIFRQGIEREENDSALLPQSKQHIAAAKYTVEIMAEAPTIVFAAMAKQEGVTEALKAAEQMEWVHRINSIRNRAEEIILTELVYA